jgi:16S rRNA processing protein RimM
LGDLVAVQHSGAQDLLVVRRPDGRERLVPFVAAIVPTVDVAGGRVVIDAPGGLLEDLPDSTPGE